MRFQTLGDKGNFSSITVRNKDAVAIDAKAPCFFQNPTNASKTGLDVVAAESLAAGDQKLFAGIAFAEIPVNGLGDALTFGFIEDVQQFVRSRSATNVTWATAAAVTVGDELLGYTAVGLQGVVVNTAEPARMVAAETLASLATAASDVTWAGGTAGTETISFRDVDVFVRAL